MCVRGTLKFSYIQKAYLGIYDNMLHLYMEISLGEAAGFTGFVCGDDLAQLVSDANIKQPSDLVGKICEIQQKDNDGFSHSFVRIINVS